MRFLETAPDEGLSDVELASALRIAAELEREEREKQSVHRATEEIGIGPEHLARALSRVIAERKSESERQSKLAAALLRISLALFGACALAVIAWPVAVWWTSPHVETRHPPLPAPAAVESELLFPVLPASGGPPHFRWTKTFWLSDMTFENRTNAPVRLEWLDDAGRRHLDATIPPGGRQQEPRPMHHAAGEEYPPSHAAPWVATDRSGTVLGYFFPMTKGTAIIDNLAGRAVRRGSGYLWPTDRRAGIPPARPVYIPTSVNTEFVNLRDFAVELYWIDDTGKAAWAAEIGPSEVHIAYGAPPGSRWLVTDRRRNLLESYAAPDSDKVAIIPPTSAEARP